MVSVLLYNQYEKPAGSAILHLADGFLNQICDFRLLWKL